MLKRKIKKADFEALDAKLQAEYKLNGEDYVLDTDDARELIAARDAEKREKDELAKKLTDANKELTTIKAANSNWETMETSYKAQLSAKDADIAALNTEKTQLMRDKTTAPVIESIASKFTVPSLIKKEIAARLDVDPRDPTKTIVLDKSGKPSALSLEDLTKEFVDNPDYKGIVIAHKGSGSAGGGLPVVPGSTPIDPNTQKPKLYSQMTAKEIVAHRETVKAAEAAAAGGGQPTT